jgi:hypothetical protein|tara:strand:- start:72 stop:200 length:129 start_codon:yes stop_codon:yes gene_type:complete
MEPFFAFLGLMEIVVLLLGGVLCLATLGGVVALVIHLSKKNN